MTLIPLHKDAWVEMNEDGAVVSWPGGMRFLTYDDPVVMLLEAIRWAITDIEHDFWRDDKRISRVKSEAYNKGWRDGWDNAKKDVSHAS
jgi:hypothetical protein